MARSTKKSPTQEIAEALDASIDLDWQETADTLGLSIPQLQERMASRLGDVVFAWELIPNEHQPVIEVVKRDLEAENSVRRLEPATEPPIPTPESPIVEDEPQPKKRGGRKKQQSTALTQKKTEAIQENRQNAAQTHSGVAETLTILSAQEGAQDGANAATAYLHGLVSNMTNIKGEGATVIAAEMLQRTANKRGFNPDEVLEKIGVPLSSQTRETLNEVMGQVLGNAQAATEEVTDTAWGNGYNVQDELTRLKNLMNLSD